MSLLSFAEGFERLTNKEQSVFEDVVQHLFTDGSIWREEEREYTLYEFTAHHYHMLSIFLSITGWELHHYERYKIFHITHRDKRNRYDFSADQIRLLLLLRLLYAREIERSPGNGLTSYAHAHYPAVAVHIVTQQFFTTYGKQVSRTALRENIRIFERFKLVRSHWKGGQREIVNAEIELLPLLEVLIPSEHLFSRLDEWTKADIRESEEAE